MNQNKELANAIGQFSESLRIMNGQFSKFQNYVEDKFNKMEVEQTDLKNRLLNVEKVRMIDHSPSPISPLATLTQKNTIDNRAQEDALAQNKALAATTLYSQYSTRYRSEKRTANQSNNGGQSVVGQSQVENQRYLDDDYI